MCKSLSFDYKEIDCMARNEILEFLINFNQLNLDYGHKAEKINKNLCL